MLKLDNISMRFDGLVVLSNVSLHIAAGELVGLIGPNGAGKTTLFNIISGFQRPSAGQVLYRGEPITATPPHRLAALGMVRTFQGARVFPKLTVRENLRVANHLRSRQRPRRRRKREAARRGGSSSSSQSSRRNADAAAAAARAATMQKEATRDASVGVAAARRGKCHADHASFRRGVCDLSDLAIIGGHRRGVHDHAAFAVL